MAVSLAKSSGRELNAVIHPAYESAVEQAGSVPLSGPFGALPFVLKDSSLASTDLPMSIGSHLFRDTSSAYNATLTQRFLDAGFLPFARSTVPELCMAPTTEAVINGGPTLNPWDHTRSSGGSSGGAAALVAAGVTPIAHGSDGGGSIRIPASCCGVFGLKPTRGRVPTGPSKGEIWGGMGTDGVLTRTVRDTALVLDAISGRELGGPYDSAPPSVSFSDAIRPDKNARPLKIGVWREAWDGIPIDQECLDAVELCATLCRELGHEIVDDTPPRFDYQTFFNSHLNVLAANVVTAVNGKLESGSKQLADGDLEPALLDAYAFGQGLTAEDYVLAINNFHHVTRVFQEHTDAFDLIISPMLTKKPVELGYFSTQGNFRDFRWKVAEYAAFSAIMNASGQPAASVPVHWAGTLPVGVQLIGQFGRDDLVLRVSAELERAKPWAHHYERLWA